MANQPVRQAKPQAYKDMNGNPVTTNSEIVKAFREMVDADYQSDDNTKEMRCELSDEIILQVVKEHSPNDNEAIVEALKDADQREEDVSAEEIAEDQSAAREEKSRAVDAAKHLTAETLGYVRTVTSANETIKIAPLAMLMRVRKDAGDGDELKGRKVMSEWPIPGTTKVNSNNPDKYSYTVKVNGENKSRNSSFYADMWDATDDGKVQNEEIAKISYASQDPPPADADETYARMHPRDRNAAKSKWSQRRNSSITLLRKAARLEHQFTAIEETCGKVEVFVARKRDDKGNETSDLMNTPRPIIIGPRGPMFAKESEVVSISSFLNMKPDVAATKGGTFQALKETNKRDTKKPDETANQLGDKTKLKINVNQTESALSAIVLQLTTDDDYNTEFGRWLNGPGSDEHVKLLGDAYIELGNWFKRVQKRYNDILENENALTSKERAAQQGNGKKGKAA